MLKVKEVSCPKMDHLPLCPRLSLQVKQEAYRVLCFHKVRWSEQEVAPTDGS